MFCGVLDERLEMAANDAVEDGLFRTAWTIRRGKLGHARALRAPCPSAAM